MWFLFCFVNLQTNICLLKTEEFFGLNKFDSNFIVINLLIFKRLKFISSNNSLLIVSSGFSVPSCVPPNNP